MSSYRSRLTPLTTTVAYLMLQPRSVDAIVQRVQTAAKAWDDHPGLAWPRSVRAGAPCDCQPELCYRVVGSGERDSFRTLMTTTMSENEALTLRNKAGRRPYLSTGLGASAAGARGPSLTHILPRKLRKAASRRSAIFDCTAT
jgi:hypothetical protein